MADESAKAAAAKIYPESKVQKNDHTISSQVVTKENNFTKRKEEIKQNLNSTIFLEKDVAILLSPEAYNKNIDLEKKKKSVEEINKQIESIKNKIEIITKKPPNIIQKKTNALFLILQPVTTKKPTKNEEITEFFEKTTNLYNNVDELYKKVEEL